jgi:hypothetical protein
MKDTFHRQDKPEKLIHQKTTAAMPSTLNINCETAFIICKCLLGKSCRRLLIKRGKIFDDYKKSVKNIKDKKKPH